MRSAALLLSSLLACARDPEAEAPSTPCDGVMVDGSCLHRPVTCGPWAVPLVDGTCAASGIAKDGCAEGFRYLDDQHYCEPILPADSCPSGQLAFLGETTCHEVAPCGEGKWGETPVDSGTYFVDGAAPATGANGTKDYPFPTIGAAISAAPAGSVVAIAAGAYDEHLVIRKSVKLWGRCPSMVSLKGAPSYGAIETYVPIEVHALAITGPSAGITVIDARDVLIDRVWIHDVANNGVLSQSTTRARAQATVRHSLIERALGIGIQASSADVTIDHVVVREGQKKGGTSGVGVHGQTDPTYPKFGPAKVTMTATVLEHHAGAALNLAAANADVDGSVFRFVDRAPLGYGISLYHPAGAPPPKAVIRRSFVDRARGAGINLTTDGCDATIVDTTVRDTEPAGTGLGSVGYGIGATAKTTLSCSGCVLMGNHVDGAVVISATATFERSIFRDTRARAFDKALGVGLFVGDRAAGLTDVAPATVTLRRSVVADNLTAGVLAIGSHLTLEEVLIERTLPRPLDGAFGDGIFTARFDAESEVGRLELRRVVVRNSARAGLLVAASEAIVEGLSSTCNALDLALTPLTIRTGGTGTPTISDRGSNLCGCDPLARCRAEMTELQPITVDGL